MGVPFQHVASCRALSHPVPHLRLPCVDADVATGPKFVLQHGVGMTNTVWTGYDIHVIQECEELLGLSQPVLDSHE